MTTLLIRCRVVSSSTIPLAAAIVLWPVLNEHLVRYKKSLFVIFKIFPQTKDKRGLRFENERGRQVSCISKYE